MGLLDILSPLSPVHIAWVTWRTGGKMVGVDAFGNRYFTAKARAGYKRERRWVLYKGEAEATANPPEWHGWIHHQTDTLPDRNRDTFRRPWQKPHHANPTGTTAAYRPPGHVLSGGVRAKATGDYQPWDPSQSYPNLLSARNAR